MKAEKLERIARAQAKTLKATLELFAQDNYLDSDGRSLLGRLESWLDHSKPIRRGK